MKRVNLPTLADGLFTFFAAFLAAFCVCRLRALPLWVCLVCSFLVALAVILPFLFFFLIRQKKRKQKSEEEQKKKNFFSSLALLPESEVISLLQKSETSFEGKTLVPLFRFAPVCEDEIARVLREKQDENIHFFVNELTPSAKELLANLTIPYSEGEEVYATLSPLQVFPLTQRVTNQTKNSRKKKLARFFSPQSAKPFFRSGVGLLLLSFLTPFPLYYVLFGCGLLLLSFLLKALSWGKR